MRDPRFDIDGQLQLFRLPRSRTRAGSLRRRLRAPLTLLALGIASAGIVGGSFAAWTAQTTNPGNQVTAGSIALGNDKSGASVFTAANVVPGDTGSSTVTITNTGTAAQSISLTQDTLAGTGIESSLRLQVYDQTRNWCYWPTNASGACAAWGNWDATGTLASLPLPATDGSARWPASQAHTFTISWQLAASSPNTDQGQTGSFRLVWDGTQ